MKINKIIKKYTSAFYICVQCGHKEKLSELTCDHCHKKGGLYLDNSNKYPLICEYCRDKGLYVNCNKCQEKVYHKALGYDYKLLIGLAIIVLVLLGGMGKYFSR